MEKNIKINCDDEDKCSCLNDKIYDDKLHPFISDGYCQDIVNNINFTFDGGDCCGSCVHKKFCIDCICKDDNLDVIYQTQEFKNSILTILTSFLK